MIHYWLPAITSSAIVALLGFVLSIPYRSSVEAAITHAFDRKMEGLKGEIRRDEEVLKASLRQREEEISALRSGALSNLTSRHIELSRRRITAIETLWSAAIDLSMLKFVAKMTEHINMDVALDEAEKQTRSGQGTRDFADVILKSAKIDDHKQDMTPDRERPFVPPLCWAMFSAYRSVISYPVIQLTLVRAGIGRKMLADPSQMMAIIKAALPHQTAFIDEYRTSAFAFLVDELEERLLSLLHEALEGPGTDREAVHQAASIIAAVDAVETRDARNKASVAEQMFPAPHYE